MSRRILVSSAAPLCLAIALALFAAAIMSAQAARIKDITDIQGIRSNQLYGVGVVTGLAGTGSGGDFTSEVARNLLSSLQIGRGLPDVSSDNMAVVLVTADLPPFIRPGNRMDATVSAIDDSISLRGGALLLTPLTGPDGQVYAVAQGPVSTGGFAVAGAAARIEEGHSTAGRIPNGAIVEREVPMEFVGRDSSFTLNLKTPDFATASRMAAVINETDYAMAEVVDAGNVDVTILAPESRGDVMNRISRIQALEVDPDTRAIVVINERTGTIVAGQNVGISPVAVSHGSLMVVTVEHDEVVQPPPFSPGDTVVAPRTEITVLERPLMDGGLTVLDRSPTVSEVARALNLLGAGPRDIISIFQAIKEAGALHAELRIM